MKLYTGDLYWPTTFEPKSYDILKENMECEVLVIGGGMGGMLCAYQLSKSGIDTVLIEKDHIAEGSSSANTGLLQYSSDKMLHEFIEDIGEEDGVDFYRMCLEAMGDLEEIDKTNINQSDFIKRDSIYYASDEEGKAKLEKEYKALKKYDFPAEYLDHEKLLNEYGISKPAAILTHGDAEVNPYKFISNIAQTAKKNGLRIFELTPAKDIDYSGEMIKVSSDNGVITAKYIVLSTGYKAERYEEIDKGELNISYAIATNQLENQPWKDNAMIWETSRPYFYARTTSDNRLVLGGWMKKEKNLKQMSKEQKECIDLLQKRFQSLYLI